MCFVAIITRTECMADIQVDVFEVMLYLQHINFTCYFIIFTSIHVLLFVHVTLLYVVIFTCIHVIFTRIHVILLNIIEF